MTNDAQHLWDMRYKTRVMVSPMDSAKKVLTYLANKPGARILDVGCGDGRDALFFAENGYAVTAIDFSAEAVDRLRTANPSINAQAMDILTIDFPSASFDAVYAHLSLHYFDNETTDKVFVNIHRMLKPGGYFFIKCKSTTDPLYGKGEKVGDDMYMNPYLRHFFSTTYM